ncbi:MAG: hypothetical protein ACYC9J_09805 [Sulfuricaulis sp.]
MSWITSHPLAGKVPWLTRRLPGMSGRHRVLCRCPLMADYLSARRVASVQAAAQPKLYVENGCFVPS